MKKICSKCHQEKPLTEFYKLSSSSDGRRPDCKDCCKRYKEELKKKDPVNYYLKLLAYGIFQRTRWEVNKPKNKCYKENGIKCLLGETPEEAFHYLKDNFEEDVKRLLKQDKTPSVDRINPNGHYEHGNIQIIDLKENVRKGVEAAKRKNSRRVKATFPDGSIKIYSSITEASKEIGCKRDTIYRAIERPGVNKRGILFELI